MSRIPSFFALIASSALASFLISSPAFAARPMPKAKTYTAQELSCKSYDDWNEATPPRHIYGNTWYVGTCGIATILIADPSGHVVIDSGTEESFDALKARLESLGIRLRDIRSILTTHEHHDHVGGVARLQEVTGAKVYVRARGKKVMATGKHDRSDPQFETLLSMKPVKNLVAIEDNQVLKLAGTQFHNIPMPGHTPAGSGWRWQQCEKGVCREFVFSDSLGAISDDHYHYSATDGLGESMRASALRLAQQPCDILITGHTSGSDIIERADGKRELVDSQACMNLSAIGLQNLEKRLQKERDTKK